MQQLKTEENRMIKETLKILSSVVAAMVMGLSFTTAHAETNFEGETVTIVIPFKEGGGTSRMFRFFSTLSLETLTRQSSNPTAAHARRWNNQRWKFLP